MAFKNWYNRGDALAYKASFLEMVLPVVEYFTEVYQ